MVQKFLAKSFNAISSKQQDIMTAAIVIGVMYALSAILGLVKNRLLISFFSSHDIGLYFIADRIPNFVLTLLTAGAFSAAFIPVFNREHLKNPNKAWDLASNVFNVLFVIFVLASLIVYILSDPIARILAYGSDLTEADYILMVGLMRTMMIAQILFVISNFLTSILQIFKSFILAALAPVVYNLGVIISSILFYKSLGIYAPALGMILGAFLHMAIQLPYVLNLGLKYGFKFDFKDKSLKQIFKLAIPRTIGQTAPQVLQLIYGNLAVFISASAVTVWKLAGDLQGVPVRLFGLSIGQAALPILSDAYEKKGIVEFRNLLTKTIIQILYFIIPMSVLIFILRIPLVRLTYGAKTFPWEATVLTAYTLAFFSISIFAQAIIGLLSKGFYAMYDTKTPLYVSLLTIGVNSVSAYVFVKVLGLGIWSLALSFTIASLLDAILLTIFMINKVGFPNLEPILLKLNKIGFASFITGIALYVPMKFLDNLIFDTTRTINLILLTGIVSLIGFWVYITLSWVFKLEELSMVLNSYSKISHNFKKFFSIKVTDDNIEPQPDR